MFVTNLAFEHLEILVVASKCLPAVEFLKAWLESHGKYRLKLPTQKQDK